jgi:hypothetical protein
MDGHARWAAMDEPQYQQISTNVNRKRVIFHVKKKAFKRPGKVGKARPRNLPLNIQISAARLK